MLTRVTFDELTGAMGLIACENNFVGLLYQKDDQAFTKMKKYNQILTMKQNLAK